MDVRVIPSQQSAETEEVVVPGHGDGGPAVEPVGDPGAEVFPAPPLGLCLELELRDDSVAGHRLPAQVVEEVTGVDPDVERLGDVQQPFVPPVQVAGVEDAHHVFVAQVPMIRRLLPEDHARYREVRLRALATDPQVFSSNLARNQRGRRSTGATVSRTSGSGSLACSTAKRSSV